MNIIPYVTASVGAPISTFNMLAVGNTSLAEDSCPNPYFENFNIQPVQEKHPAYVLGEQIRKLFSSVSSLFSYIYEKLPSLSVANASSLPCEDTTCLKPVGSYEKSCHIPKLTFISEDRECELTTRCETYYEDMPHKKNTLRFTPNAMPLILENKNGTLLISSSYEEHINKELALASKNKEAATAQSKVIANLVPGTVVTLDNNLELSVTAPTNKQSDDTIKAFQRLAQNTGGIMGHAFSAKSLSPLTEKIFAHILQAASSSKTVDIAFVLDTTSSMAPHIDQVKRNLADFIEKVQQQHGKNKNFRVALVEYRDTDASSQFLRRLKTDFTSNFNTLQESLKEVKTEGGNDIPEGALDALSFAKNQLLWQPSSKRFVLLISDAPFHARTQEGLTEDNIIDSYKELKAQIAIYPIFTKD